MSDSIKEKAIRGVGWSALDNVLSYGMTFTIGIILARLLSPDDYGLIGLVGIFTAICNCFINAGFSSALIRKKNATLDDYNTVFICNLVMSVVMYGIVYLLAPVVASYFARPELTTLTRVSSLGMIVGALGLVQSTRLTKRIDFKTQTKITIISTIIQGCVGISLAFLGYGVWALVWQGLTAIFLRTILLWGFNHWVPKLHFSLKSFKELFGFSSKLLVSSLIDNVWGQLYQAVIGKFYAPATLGQYTRAIGYSSLFSSNLTSVIQRVSYPVLSELQEDKERLKAGYKKIIKTTMFLTFFSSLILAAISKSMIIVLIGEKWTQAAYFLQIICFSSMLFPLHVINLNMLQVQGRSDLFLRLEIIKKMIAIGPLLLGIFVGIYWMLIGSVFVSLICYYLNAYYSGTYVNYNMYEQVRDIFPSFAVGLTAAVFAWMPVVIYELLFDIANRSTLEYVLVLCTQLLMGFSIFILLCRYYQLSEYVEIKDILKSKLKNVFRRRN